MVQRLGYELAVPGSNPGWAKRNCFLLWNVENSSEDQPAWSSFPCGERRGMMPATPLYLPLRLRLSGAIPHRPYTP